MLAPERMSFCVDRVRPSISPIVLYSKAFVRLRPAHRSINAVDRDKQCQTFSD